MDEASPHPKSKQSARSSRYMSSSSRTSSIISQLPESDSADAKWRRCLVDLLGDEGADYFINPKPKEHKVVIDEALYRCHGLDDAWKLLRNRAESRMREKTRLNASSRNVGDFEEEDDRAYESFARFLLQKGRIFPPRIFSEKATVFKQQLEKLSDRRGPLRAARYSQESGVSYRSAIVNTERCAHLLEQATGKGNTQLNVDRKTTVFLDSFSEVEISLDSSILSHLPPSSSSQRGRSRTQPKLIFLTSEEAAEEAEQLSKLWSRQFKNALPFSGNVSLRPDAVHVGEFAPTMETWQPLGYNAAAEWGRVISKTE